MRSSISFAVFASALWVALASPARSEDGKGAAPGWPAGLRASAFVDTYVSFNPNLPPDGANFFPGVGSTANRANTFGLNLAGLDLGFGAGPVSGRLQLVLGSAARIVSAGEPVGLSVGPDVYGGVYEAYVSYAAPFLPGLVLDAGVFSSHIGFESFFSQDNWAYTRGWMAELSPYYQAGAKATYRLPWLEQLSFQLLLLNGWQLIVDNNLAKSLGAQVAWNDERLSFALNGWAGPELPGDDSTWRFFGDTVLVLRPFEALSLSGSLDVGYEPRQEGAVHWWAAGVHGRLAVFPWLAVAGRTEHVQDPFGVVSGIGQSLTEGTLTLEFVPTENLTVKLEARADHSTEKVFARRASTGDLDGANTQGLLVLGVVGRI